MCSIFYRHSAVFMLSFGLCMVLSPGMAQLSADIPALQVLLTQDIPDTARARMLNDIGYTLIRNSDPSALSYAEQSYELAEKISYAKGSANALLTLGMIDVFNKKIDEGMAK